LEVSYAEKRVALAKLAVEELDRSLRHGADALPTKIREIRLQLEIAKLQLEKAILQRSHQLEIAEVNVKLARRRMEMAQSVAEEAVLLNRMSPGSIPDPELQRRRLLWEMARVQFENAQLAIRPTPSDVESD